MTLEKLKTITLMILVLLSLVLTYFLWTYEPNYEPLHNLETVEKVTLAAERPLSEVIKPIQLFYHDDNTHWGTYNSQHLSPFYQLLLDATFVNFETHTLDSRLRRLVKEHRSIEFVYADGVSMNVFHQLLDFNQERPMLSDVERIVLFEKRNGNRIKMFAWFVSKSRNSYIEAEIKNQTFQAYEDVYERERQNFLAVKPLNIGSDRMPIYFPIKQLKLNRLQAYPVPIPELELTNALFSDPNLVRESYREADIRSYTDGNSELKLYLLENYLTYINPTRRGEQQTDDVEESPFLQVHRFINSHGGYTEPFTFMGIKRLPDNKTEVEFHLSFNGYPSFDARIAEMKVIWQEQEVFEYIRATETISDSVIYKEPDMETLLTAEELEYSLKQSLNVDMKQIDNLTLGYMVSTYDDYLVFTPNWYMYYRGTWEPILKESNE